MSAVPVPSDASRRRDRIKLLLGSMVETKEKIFSTITEARDHDDHLALGYRSWTEYVSTEYAGLLSDLNRDDRRDAAFALAQTGMSTRAIAPIVGVSNKTVHQDLQVLPEVTPAPEAPAAPASDDRAFSEALANMHQIMTTVPAPSKVVTGTDGRRYPSARPRRRRRVALPDQYWRAVYDLTKVVERIEKLTADDRFPSARAGIAIRNKAEIAAAHKALWKIRQALGGEQ